MTALTPQQKVANLIKNERKKRNWKREDLADKIYVSDLTIKNWESGSAKVTAYITPENAIKLEKAFGLAIGTIYDVYYEGQRKISTYRKLRILNGFTTFSAAKRLGVSDSTLSRWESGDSQPGADSIVAMAKLYNTTPNELLEFNLNESSNNE